MGETRARAVIEASFLKKGFLPKPGGDHYRYVYATTDGRKISVHTKVSRGTAHKNISDPLLALMARQCKLAKPDFLALVDCPMPRDGYAEKLKQQGVFA
jgi:hypothetical protein